MGFHENMKFLVVDADKANVNYLKGALQYLGCEVKACKYKEQALSLLRQQKRKFDIILVDVDIPYEMGLKFVEIVSSKMNIPIIMMCSAIDNEIMAAAMNFSACQIAAKPVGFEDVRRFWQCALEHRKHLLGVGNSARNSEGLNGQENGSKHGTIEEQLHGNRLVWTEDLNALFVDAIDALGGKDMASPKKILELMNVPNLTRENIASHLQKYRLYSDPNYHGRNRKRKAARAMEGNGIGEQAPVVAHHNRRVLSFESPEFTPNAQNVPCMNYDSTRGNRMTGYGNQQDEFLEESEIAQFLDMSEQDTWQQLYNSPNVQPSVPEPPAVPEVFGDRPWPSLPTQSSLEVQVPSDGIRSEQTPTSPGLDPELESFLAMELSDPNFPFLDVYPPQDMSMIYGGLSNGLHDNNYQVGQSEMGNDDLLELNYGITNDPATDSIIMDNPVAMHYPQNISAKGGIVDHSNIPWQQQQEQIRGTPQEKPWSLSGQGVRYGYS